MLKIFSIMPQYKTPDYSPAGILCPGGNCESSAKPHWCWVSDFCPFGMQMPDRSYVATTMGYRFGFNGKEDINEFSGWQDYGMRMYNTSTARFISADPLIVNEQQYADLSSYQFASNTPVWGIDLDGLELSVSIHGQKLIGPVALDKINAKILSEGAGNPMYANIIIRQERINQDFYSCGSINVNDEQPLVHFHWNSELVFGAKYKVKVFGYGVEMNAAITHNLTTFSANETGSNSKFWDGNWNIELGYGSGLYSISTTINNVDIQIEGKLSSYKPSYSLKEGFSDRFSIIDLSIGMGLGGDLSLSISNPFSGLSTPPIPSKTQADPSYTPAVSSSTSRPVVVPLFKF